MTVVSNLQRGLNKSVRAVGRIARSQGLLRNVSGRLLGLSLLAAVAFFAPRGAWADTISVFDVSSGSGSGGIFSGTNYSFGAGSEITIDTTTGTVQGANVIVDKGNGVVATFSGTPNLLNNPAGYIWYYGTSDFLLSTLPNSFVGFTGCQSCSGIVFEFPSLFSGTVSLTSAPPVSAPEPASIGLLGAGLLGLSVLMLRRRQTA